MTRDEQIQALADLITKDTLAERTAYQKRYYPDSTLDYSADCQAHIRPGTKYTKIDVGSSGKYMIDGDGNIWGIKGYGVIHRGHWYGTLDTINDYYWGGYVAGKKGAKPKVYHSAAPDKLASITEYQTDRPSNILQFRLREVAR